MQSVLQLALKTPWPWLANLDIRKGCLLLVDSPMPLETWLFSWKQLWQAPLEAVLRRKQSLYHVFPRRIQDDFIEAIAARSSTRRLPVDSNAAVTPSSHEPLRPISLWQPSDTP